MILPRNLLQQHHSRAVFWLCSRKQQETQHYLKTKRLRQQPRWFVSLFCLQWRRRLAAWPLPWGLSCLEQTRLCCFDKLPYLGYLQRLQQESKQNPNRSVTLSETRSSGQSSSSVRSPMLLRWLASHIPSPQDWVLWVFGFVNKVETNAMNSSDENFKVLTQLKAIKRPSRWRGALSSRRLGKDSRSKDCKDWILGGGAILLRIPQCSGFQDQAGTVGYVRW